MAILNDVKQALGVFYDEPTKNAEIAEIIAGVQPDPDLRGNDPQPRPVLVQPEHLRTLHAPHEICFGNAHSSASGISPVPS